MDAVLAGLTVVDLSQLAQGPFATQILGDMGAEVIKIEPLAGDWMRRFAVGNSYLGDQSISFLSFNRNKRSIALDAKHPEGLALVKALVAKADVLVENFRPGVMDRLGLGYEDLSALNPGLVYCSSSGYGQSGPYRTRPGQDLLIQALTGLTYLNGRRSDPPIPVGLGVADLVSGLHIAYGVLAALVSRGRTGRGQRVEVNLLDSLMALQMQEFTAYLNGFGIPDRHVTASSAPHVGPPFGIYATSDGYLALAMNPMDTLGPLLGLPEQYWVADINLSESAESLFDDIAAACKTRRTQEWLDILLKADIWCAPVQRYEDVEVDPQVIHNGLIQTMSHPTAGPVRTLGPAVEFSAAQSSIRRPPPRLGEHSCEVLSEVLNLDLDYIDDLLRRDIVAQFQQ